MGYLASLLSLVSMIGMLGLNVGDKAPALDGITWLKGEAPAFEKQYTVVEFWATWCGACRGEIPRLTRLQKFYEDSVAIVGLSDESQDKITQYLEQMGNSMDYGVGKVPKELREQYMKGVGGIPHAFMVNPEGVVIWSGHPRDLEEILEKALSGTLDVEKMRQIAGLERHLKETLNKGNLVNIGQAADALLSVDPSNERALRVQAVVARRQNDVAAFRIVYDRIDVKTLGSEKANRLAWSLVTEKDLAFRYMKAAMKLAAYSVKEEPDNGNYANTYARVQYCLGNLNEALKWQKKAVDLDPGEKSYKTTLQYYEEIRSLQD
ncbi:MAG: redoxin domain-containing protein [Desulfatiglandales bacterium]